jgi:hypothetical protein
VAQLIIDMGSCQLCQHNCVWAQGSGFRVKGPGFRAAASVLHILTVYRDAQGASVVLSDCVRLG